MVYQRAFAVSAGGHCDVCDITAQVAHVVSDSKISTGIANVACCGSTVGITTIEFEPGCLADLRRVLEQLAPAAADYAHNARWGDNNGFSHVRSALLGTSRSFPVIGGQLAVGSWQQIVLCDFDDRAREREIIVNVVGG
jgi:secondary thiamine-phosphate synthase enzyme